MNWKEKIESRFEAHGIPENHDVQVLAPLIEGDEWTWNVSIERSDEHNPERQDHLIMVGTAVSAETAREEAQRAYKKAVRAISILEHGDN